MGAGLLLAMAGAYYNEIDPYAAQWLRNLIAAGHIAPGDVDERDIRLVRADDLRGYSQCHFFAGIGVWSYALRLAGWPDDRRVWTGSCPCQPFSTAGRAGGFDDERHLWPHWKGLILERGANPVIGEQVASKDGLAWLDFVCADLESAGYAVGALDLCAAGFGAPHIRQRIFFVGDTNGAGRKAFGNLSFGSEERPAQFTDTGTHGHGRLADADLSGKHQRASGREQPIRHERGEGACALAYAGSEGPQELRRRREQPAGSPTAGFWGDADWLPCTDGKARPVEPGTFPLAHGITGRMGKLRAYGNAIVAPVAAEFIRAYLDASRSMNVGT